METRDSFGGPEDRCDTLTTLYLYPIFFGLGDTALQAKLNSYFAVMVLDTMEIGASESSRNCERIVSVQHLRDSLPDPDEEWFARVDVTFLGGGILSYTYEAFLPGGTHPIGDYDAETIDVTDQSAVSLNHLFSDGYKRVFSAAVKTRHDTTTPEEKHLRNQWLTEVRQQNTGEGFILADTSAFLVRDGRVLWGGAEIARGFNDISISYHSLLEVIRPNGPLERFRRPGK